MPTETLVGIILILATQIVQLGLLAKLDIILNLIMIMTIYIYTRQRCISAPNVYNEKYICLLILFELFKHGINIFM